MSFFGRGALLLAVTAGVVHVFRKDLRRILGAVSKPASKFVSEVRQELEKPAEEKAGDGQVKAVAAPPPPIVEPAKVTPPPPAQTPAAPAESSSANKEQPLR